MAGRSARIEMGARVGHASAMPNPTEPPALVIFDLDGVLADSELLSAAALIAELAEIGHEVTPAEVRRDFLGRSFPTVAAGLRARLGAAFPADFEDRTHDCYRPDASVHGHRPVRRSQHRALADRRFHRSACDLERALRDERPARHAAGAGRAGYSPAGFTTGFASACAAARRLRLTLPYRTMPQGIRSR